MTLNASWTKYLLLQLAVFAVEAVTTWFALALAIFLVWPLTAIAGLVLLAKAFLRRKQTGILEDRFLGISALALPGFAFCWVLVLGMIGNAMRVAPMGLGLIALWAPALGVFSAGSLAYLGLGPFRSRLPAIERVRQILADGRSARIGFRATSDQIAEAERALGLRLPASFVEFLKTWGELEIGPTKVLGIPGATQMERPSAGFAQATLDGRANLGLPTHFILCVSYPNSLHVCLDTFSMRSDEGPAVLWNSSTRVVTQTLAPTFADFLRDQLEAMAPSR